MAQFEGKERRQATLDKVLPEYGFNTLEEAQELCLSKGINVDEIVKGIQLIAFENAVWAYTLGCAIALKRGIKTAAEAAEAIGLGLQAFAVPGSVGDQRKVGIGHGNLAAMLLREETKRFCFLAPCQPPFTLIIIYHKSPKNTSKAILCQTALFMLAKPSAACYNIFYETYIYY